MGQGLRHPVGRRGARPGVCHLQTGAGDIARIAVQRRPAAGPVVRQLVGVEALAIEELVGQRRRAVRPLGLRGERDRDDHRRRLGGAFLPDLALRVGRAGPRGGRPLIDHVAPPKRASITSSIARAAWHSPPLGRPGRGLGVQP